ncbi:hypothetical protein PHLGIDRAFT_117348 [Phlebiopsis gigantea 11061_1 CR5-6]|uniref:DUF6535 domain-containing protein n=1 Tax=Phlebiopsis gigantea (strain 11061_1 CR5-6) TaxID=745531 RepID=A0A0C3PNI1_PHLG1|nr:hypothetical protein PHLGIDRAFT_117348 [Phlebiopsis gigantea 11061_1 CR5-6]
MEPAPPRDSPNLDESQSPPIPPPATEGIRPVVSGRASSEQALQATNTQPLPKRPPPQRPNNMMGGEFPLAKPLSIPEAWSTMLKSTQEFEKEKVDAWKDEMGNLLVFAGLLSAVVTAFVIDSYKTLQEDQTKRSADLLQQISSQLLSFNVSPNLMNSTTATSALQTVAASSSPRTIDVRINSLWFISLSFSLSSSFLAIAVQQWLRALPQPQNLPTPQIVILRQAHWASLIYWQVPNIINFLPVLLQAALVLFLVGLVLFLHGLNHPVATAFSVATGIPIFAYAILIVLPLIWHRCPFRSPLVPTAIFIWEICRVVIVPAFLSALFLAMFALELPIIAVVIAVCIALYAVLFAVVAALLALGSPFLLIALIIIWCLKCIKHRPTRSDRESQIMEENQSRASTASIGASVSNFSITERYGPMAYMRRLTQFARKVPQPPVQRKNGSLLHSFVQTLAETNNFWNRRAMHFVSDDLGIKYVQNGPDSSSTLRFRKTALIRAPESMSTEKLNDLFLLFQSLDKSERAICVLHWVVGRSQIYEVLPSMRVSWAANLADPWFADQYRRFLLDALPVEDDLNTSSDWIAVKDHPFSLLLILLSKIAIYGVTFTKSPQDLVLQSALRRSLVDTCSKADYSGIRKNRYPIPDSGCAAELSQLLKRFRLFIASELFSSTIAKIRKVSTQLEEDEGQFCISRPALQSIVISIGRLHNSGHFISNINSLRLQDLVKQVLQAADKSADKEEFCKVTDLLRELCGPPISESNSPSAPSPSNDNPAHSAQLNEGTSTSSPVNPQSGAIPLTDM